MDPAWKYLERLAQLRLNEIKEEEAVLLHAFPQLKSPRAIIRETETAQDRGPRKRGRRFTAAERKEKSRAMKAYWAERRKKEKG